MQNIGHIDLKGSDVKDIDLKHIEGINIRSIDLSNTQITGEGLKYLKQNKRWTSVELDGCPNIKPEYLTHFRGWKNATIRLVDYKWSGEKYSKKEQDLS